jgi:hypothetical protein
MMEITESQYQQIEGCLPRQRSNVSLSNLLVPNAILSVAEQGSMQASGLIALMFGMKEGASHAAPYNNKNERGYA